MALRISKGGEHLDLKPGTRLPIDLNSPIYFGDRDAEVIPGLKTYSINVPNSSHNRRLLNRPADLDNPQRMLNEPGWSLYHDGRFISSGILIVEDSGLESDIKISYVGGVAGNLASLKDKNIGSFFAGMSVDLGETEQEVINYAISVAGDPDSSDFLFPTIRVETDPAMEEQEDGSEIPTRYSFLNLYTLGRYVTETPLFFDHNNPGDTEFAVGTLSPQPRLHYVLRQLLASVGFKLTGIFDAGDYVDEMRNLILVTNATLDTAPPAGPDDIRLQDVTLDTTLNLASIMPKVKAADLIKKVAARFCLSAFIDEKLGRVRLLANKDLLKDATYIDWTDKVDPRHTNSRQSFTIPQNFRTPFPSSDGFSATQGLNIDPGSIIIPVELFAELQELPIDYTKIYYIASTNSYVRLRGVNGNNRRYYLVGRDLGQIGRNLSPSYTAGASSLLSVDNNYRFPAYYNEPVSPFNESEVTDDCILLFYRGIQETRDGIRDYPLAQSGRYDISRNPIAELSLLWNGQGGLYDKWWKEWIAAMHFTKPVSFRVRLTSSDIANLDFSRKIKVANHLYFIKRISTSLNDAGVGVAAVDFVKTT